MSITIAPMARVHLPAIEILEEQCFSTPWAPEDLLAELLNKHVIAFAAVDTALGEATVAGYCFMRHMVNEGHITNIAVAETYRRRGIAALLMHHMEAAAKARSMIGLTLEVRQGNRAAMALYARFGFKVEGYRPHYYQHPTEDAVIMWKYF